MSREQELLRLIAELEAEERRFQERAEGMQHDQQRLDEEHNQFDHYHRHCEDNYAMRATHQAMFKVHRKMARQHARFLQGCRQVVSRLNSGFYADREITREIQRIRELLEKTRSEHARIEDDRKQIVREHESFVRSLHK
jgi:hypothetical protein